MSETRDLIQKHAEQAKDIPPAPEGKDEAAVFANLSRIEMCMRMADRHMQELSALCERMESQRDEAMKDAQRYRWIRNGYPGPDPRLELVGEELDAVIDDALADLARLGERK